MTHRSGAAVQIENVCVRGHAVASSAKDAGALLRFLNVYGRVQGGRLQLSLAGEKTLRGRLEMRDFDIVDEPKLSSLVSRARRAVTAASAR